MKIIKMISNILLMAALTLGLFACPGGTGGNSAVAHEHTYSTEWSADDTYHWHGSTFGHTSEIQDKAEHTFGDWIIDTAATVSAYGSKHKTCSVCNHSITETIAKVEISFGDITVNYDSFDGDFNECIYVGKTYKVIVTIKDSEGNDITSSDSIEYELKFADGTTNKNGVWVTVENGEQSGEFNVTPKSAGIDEHPNFSLNYRVKGGTWTSRSLSTIAIYSE